MVVVLLSTILSKWFWAFICWNTTNLMSVSCFVDCGTHIYHLICPCYIAVDNIDHATNATLTLYSLEQLALTTKYSMLNYTICMQLFHYTLASGDSQLIVPFIQTSPGLCQKELTRWTNKTWKKPTVNIPLQFQNINKFVAVIENSSWFVKPNSQIEITPNGCPLHAILC